MYEFRLPHHTDYVRSIDVSKDNKYFVSGGRDNLVKLWDIQKKKNIKTFKASFFVNSVVFSPNGKFIASSNQYDIQIWDVKSGKEIKKIEISGSIDAIFSPSGKYLAVIAQNKPIELWNTRNWKKIKELKTNMNIKKIIFTPNGKYILAYYNYFDKKSKREILRVWDVESGKKIKDLKLDLEGSYRPNLLFTSNEKYFFISIKNIISTYPKLISNPSRFT